MGRPKKPGFKEMKMLSSRVELEDYLKFEKIIKYRDGKKLQQMLNKFIVEYISGNIYLDGDKFEVKE